MSNQPLKRRVNAVKTAAAIGALAFAGASPGAELTVIELTQVGCQFIESEYGVTHRTSTGRLEERLKKAKVLQLKPGKYVFRVTNENVPYPLGFWVRGDGILNRARLPSVSGGGLTMGKSRDYEIDLKPGEYVYSCPLNPTPDYKLVVSG